MNRKRLAPKGHRRQYLSNRRNGFYELLKLRSHAEKYERWRAAFAVELINAAKTTVAGTTSHEEARSMLASWARSNLGPFARFWLWVRIAYARLSSEKRALGFNQHVKSVHERIGALQKAA